MNSRGSARLKMAEAQGAYPRYRPGLPEDARGQTEPREARAWVVRRRLGQLQAGCKLH